MTSHMVQLLDDAAAQKAAAKEERAWKKTMAAAKVFDANPLPRRTAEVLGDEMLARLLKQTDSMIASNSAAVAKFSEKLASDPAYELSWSSSAFDAAAGLSVARKVQASVRAALERGDEYDSPSALRVVRWTRDYLLREVVQATRSPSRSSSAQSNEMARSVASVQAMLLGDVDMWLGFYKL